MDRKLKQSIILSLDHHPLLKNDILFYKNYIRNSKLIKFAKKSEQLNLIQNNFGYTELINKIKLMDTGIKMVSGINSESNLYGHLSTLLHYSGLKFIKDDILVKIEHGIDFSEFITKENYFSIYQGSYKMKKLHDENPCLPIFTVGPYIHYAEHFLSDDVRLKIKRQWGKTLLFFPVHSYELSSVSIDKTILLKKISEYQKRYQTVLICAYWNDYTHPIYKELHSLGCKIVSAGFRSDRLFLSRLKTLIDLSDAIVSNGIGTYIGYSIALNKPFSFITELMNTTKIQDTESSYNYILYNNNLTLMLNVFSQESTFITNDQLNICNRFWGIDNIKSSEEMNAIFLIHRSLSNYLKKNNYNMTKSVKTLLQYYIDNKQKNPKLQLQHRLLKEALSDGN